MAGDRPLNWEVVTSLGDLRLKELKRVPELPGCLSVDF